jgi:hypothetical protein
MGFDQLVRTEITFDIDWDQSFIDPLFRVYWVLYVIFLLSPKCHYNTGANEAHMRLEEHRPTWMGHVYRCDTFTSTRGLNKHSEGNSQFCTLFLS